MTQKRVKPKMCRVCKQKFQPTRPMQPTCAEIECMVAYGKQAAEKKKAKNLEQQGRQMRKQIRERKEKLKTRSDYIKEAQIAFNRFIRLRDQAKPCICCGATLTTDAVGGGFDCGHYRSVGSAPHLRYNEDNAHGQTKKCNRYGAGRAVDYRLGLIKRIGLARVEALEADQSVKKYTIDDLKTIKAFYVAKLKEIRNGA